MYSLLCPHLRSHCWQSRQMDPLFSSQYGIRSNLQIQQRYISYIHESIALEGGSKSFQSQNRCNAFRPSINGATKTAVHVYNYVCLPTSRTLFRSTQNNPQIFYGIVIVRFLGLCRGMHLYQLSAFINLMRRGSKSLSFQNWYNALLLWCSPTSAFCFEVQQTQVQMYSLVLSHFAHIARNFKRNCNSVKRVKSRQVHLKSQCSDVAR